MSEELNQGDQQPNENVEENETLENEEVEFAEEEKALWEEETSKKVDSLSAQKKHWREKHDKVLKELSELKKKPSSEPKEKKETKPAKDEEINLLKSELQEVRLAQSNPSLKPEQIKKAVAWAKAEGIEPQEMIASDDFQALIKIQADKAAAAQSAPNPSNRSSAGGKVNFDNMSEENITNLSDSEYEKYQDYLMAKSGGSRSGLKVNHSVKM